ncbi:hypothetical protein F5972_19395 [Microbispora cellulosiformans]|uniref:DUF2690 domain-containing protein n=1 Tax=Microbispora cellulosiformans TaxID=2614688 RepID=A0A5J5K3E8_9ACTN|nr:hypothetical protein [Microbispora cellulosiformans]KAA9377759.1 hypothetical protein F5972_19395 [Microbispora cellulosiformans]
MRSKIAWRMSKGAALSAAVAGLVLLSPAPQANAGTCSLGFICGYVENYLPSSYTVKVAELGVGSETCVTQEGTFTCKTYWLPSGTKSKQIGVKDVDALTVENAAWTTNNNSTWFGAGAWERIHDDQGRVCSVKDGHPACYQN